MTPLCVCRSVYELPSDRRGAGEPQQAAAPAGLCDRRSGLGHLQTRPVHPAADAPPGTPHHAALPHPPRQVRPAVAGSRGNRSRVGGGQLPVSGTSCRRLVPPMRLNRRERLTLLSLRSFRGQDLFKVAIKASLCCRDQEGGTLLVKLSTHQR